MAKRPSHLVRWFPLALTLVLGLATQTRRIRIVAHSSEVLFLDYQEALFDLDLRIALAILYLIIGCTFALMGQELGRRFCDFPTLQAYSINTLGSLTGVLVFTALSWFTTPAYVWAIVGFVPLLWFLRCRKPLYLMHLLSAVLCVAIVAWSGHGAIWGPYQKISTSPLQINMKTGNPYPHEAGQNPADIKFFPESTGFNLLVNGLFYQQPLALSDASIEANPLLRHLRKQYDIPWKFGSNDRVLIVGGGSGNDAAAALRNGAKQVHVVDIDPAIVEVGRLKHPDRPYSDPRVTVTIDDARAFFRKQAGKVQYDKIAFGLVDSHVLTSSLSNIRIDSYVYTQEAFRDAARLLSPQGIMVVNFTIVSPKFADKLYRMLETGLRSPPVVLSELQKQVLGVTLVAGPGVAPLLKQVGPRSLTSTVPPSTDDWPFFYLLEKQIGSDYLVALALILGLSTALVFFAVPGRVRKIQWHFFWLGAAFMLLESRSITTLALLFGSTWKINSIVFAAVLLAIWLSNLVVQKLARPSSTVFYVGLSVSLLAAYLLVQQVSAAGLGLVTVILTFAPIFFAGMIFSTSFSKSSEPDQALGSNILGCILGGSLEYVSMIAGFHALWILTANLYFASWLWRTKVS